MKTLAALKVLVVEDEALVSMLVEDMLSDLGCVVVGPAAELEEATVSRRARVGAGTREIQHAMIELNEMGSRARLAARRPDN